MVEFLLSYFLVIFINSHLRSASSKIYFVGQDSLVSSLYSIPYCGGGLYKQTVATKTGGRSLFGQAGSLSSPIPPHLELPPPGHISLGTNNESKEEDGLFPGPVCQGK